MPQTHQEPTHEQQACLNESLTFPSNLGNDSQQSITTFFSHSEMQQATQPQQAATKIQNNLHNDDPLQHCIMSGPISQFFLNNLLNNHTLNKEQHKSEIDNMKSFSQWTFYQLYVACKRSMSIDGSALANLSEIIETYKNIQMKMENKELKNCCCLKQIRQKAILKRIIKYMKIPHLHSSRRKLLMMKFNFTRSKTRMSKRNAEHAQCFGIQSSLLDCNAIK